MQLAHNSKQADPVSEMTIVNTFTKLIFGEDAYSTRELAIIDGFRMVEADVLRDSLEEMGDYLRNLGVREMIQLVSRLHRYLADPDATAFVESVAFTPGRNASPGSVTPGGKC